MQPLRRSPRVFARSFYFPLESRTEYSERHVIKIPSRGRPISIFNLKNAFTAIRTLCVCRRNLSIFLMRFLKLIRLYVSILHETLHCLIEEFGPEAASFSCF